MRIKDKDKAETLLEKRGWKDEVPPQQKAFSLQGARKPVLMDKTWVQKQVQSGSMREVKDPERVMSFIASTADVDRQGDIVRQEGWDLVDFQKNPVCLWNHDQDKPIGRAVMERVQDVEGVGKSLCIWMEWMDKSHGDHIEPLFNAYRDGFLRGGSVGFEPRSIDPVTEPSRREEMGMGETGVMFTDQTLAEWTLCTVPANQNALATALRSAPSDLQKTLAPVLGVPLSKVTGVKPPVRRSGKSKAKAKAKAKKEERQEFNYEEQKALLDIAVTEHKVKKSVGDAADLLLRAADLEEQSDPDGLAHEIAYVANQMVLPGRLKQSMKELEVILPTITSPEAAELIVQAMDELIEVSSPLSQRSADVVEEGQISAEDLEIAEQEAEQDELDRELLRELLNEANEALTDSLDGDTIVATEEAVGKAAQAIRDAMALLNPVEESVEESTEDPPEEILNAYREYDRRKSSRYYHLLTMARNNLSGVFTPVSRH